MRIRERAGTDHMALLAIAHAVHELDGYPPYLPDGDLDRFLFGHESLSACVADVDGEIAGHVALHPRSSPPVMQFAADLLDVPQNRLGVIARLLVSPHRRRSGLATALLNHAALDAQSRGLFPVLDVLSGLLPARHLYENAGWECAGEVEVQIPNGPSLHELVYLAPPALRPSGSP